MIFGPDGRPLCEHIPEDQEGILYAEIDPDQIAIAKAIADPVGHYSRPDVVRLLINREKRAVVQEFRPRMCDMEGLTQVSPGETELTGSATTGETFGYKMDHM